MAWLSVAGRQTKVSLWSHQYKSCPLRHKSPEETVISHYVHLFSLPQSRKEYQINSESTNLPAWMIAGRFQWVKFSIAFIQHWNVVRGQGIGWLSELWNQTLGNKINQMNKYLEVFLLAWFCMRPTLDYFEPHLILPALFPTIKIITIMHMDLLYSENHHFIPELEIDTWIVKREIFFEHCWGSPWVCF